MFFLLVKKNDPISEELAAYARIEEAMEAGVEYYECFTDLAINVEVRLNPTVRTAQASNKNSFSDQSFVVEFGIDPYVNILIFP